MRCSEGGSFHLECGLGPTRVRAGGDACGTVLGKNFDALARDLVRQAGISSWIVGRNDPCTWREVASFKSEIDDVIHPERVHTQIYAPR